MEQEMMMEMVKVGERDGDCEGGEGDGDHECRGGGGWRGT